MESAPIIETYEPQFKSTSILQLEGAVLSPVTHWGRKIKEALRIKKLWGGDAGLSAPLLYKVGYTVTELADGFGVPQSQIWGILALSDVPARRSGRRSQISDKEWKQKKAEYNNRCAYCDKRSKQLEMDHIIPLANGGKDEIANIVPACRKCNPSKGKRSLRNWKPFKKLQLNLSQI